MATISDDNVVISVEVDSKDAEGKLKVLKTSIDDVGESSERGFSKAQASVVAFSSALQAGAIAFGALKATFQAVSQLLPEAGRIDALSRSFEQLQESVGNNANESLEKFRQTTQGLVSDLDLFTVANKAVLLNLPTEGFQEASASAIKLGRAMGIDAKQAIDDFTTGVGRGSVLILDNLGILVDAEKAYKEYAESIGTTSSKLDENQKKTAFANEAYRQIIESAKNTAQVTLNASDAYQQLRVSVSNLTVEFLKQLGNNEELRDSLVQLRLAIGQVDVQSLIDGFNGLVGFVSTVVIPTFNGLVTVLGTGIRTIQLFKESLDTISFGGVTGDAKDFNKSLEVIAPTLGSINAQFRDLKTTADLEKIKKDFQTLQQSINSTDKGAEQYGDTLLKLQAKILAVDKNSLTLSKTNKDVADSLGGASGVINATNASTVANTEARQKVDELTESQKKLADQNREVQASFDRITQDIKANEEAIEREFIALSEQLASDLESSLGSAIGDAIRGAFEGANSEDYKDIGASLGASIGSSLASSINPALAPIGQALGDKLGEKVFEGFEAFVNGNREDIKKSLDIFVFGLSGQVGLKDFFGGLLGGKDAEANARRALTNTLNDAIKSARKDFGINLASFYIPRGRDGFDAFVNEAGEITTAVTEEFKKIPPEVQAIFGNLAPALQSAFNLDELNQGQIQQIFATNFGGLTNNLNDLQLLFQSMGLSAEQVAEQLEQAFLTGDLGAEQFLGSLTATRDLFTQGIPGAIGATDQAFQNLVSGGLQSGRQAFDALGDIASEAGEKGIDSFSALRADLIASGKSVTEVDKLLQALASNGINSIEELRNISVEQTAGVVSALNNLSFGFQEITEDVNQLKKQLDEIKSKSVDIEFNVKTNYDNNTQQLLNNTVTSQYIPSIGNA